MAEHEVIPRSMGPVTAKCIKLCESFEIGQEMSYEQVAEAVGHKIRVGEEAYGSMRTAIRHVRRYHGIVIQTVPKFGFRRPKPDEHAVLLGDQRRYVMRKAKTAHEIAETLDLAALGPEEKNGAIHLIGQLRLLNHWSTHHATARIGKVMGSDLPSASDLVKRLTNGQ